MDGTEKLEGTIDRFIYQNHENGFSVCILVNATKQSITVRGYLSHLHPGETITVAGGWIVHPKFGKQFDVKQCAAHIPTSLSGLKKYLASGLIKGVGPTYAEKLVDHFGTTVLEVIDTKPQLLNAIPGIGPKRIETIAAAWQEQKAISHIMVFLQDKGISTAYAVKIYKKYGQNAIHVVNENPYRLAQEVWGIGFTIADQIAQNMGFTQDSIKRIKAGILYALTLAVNNGHLYVELKNLRIQSIELLSLNADASLLIKSALHELHAAGMIVLITHNKNHYVAQTQHYQIEKSVATMLQILSKNNHGTNLAINSIYTRLRTKSYIKQALSDDQERGIMECLKNAIIVITGGPGTGKTTLIKTLLALFDEQKIKYKMAAPTGRAAKRITESTSKRATTLHRLLEFDPGIMGFKRTEKNPLSIDALIIDEASMIDIFLAYAILKALPTTARLILIGDINQLPSVGAGNFLNDIIESATIPCVRLTHIFRQAQDSLIVTNAHRINRGEFPLSNHTTNKSDYIFIKEEDPALVAERLRTVYLQLLPSYGIKYDNAITLVPMKRGIAGTQTLNHCIQEFVNPDSTATSITLGDFIFKLHDRVMQIRNNYDKLIFNGDIGFIEKINAIERTITVHFPEQRADYDNTDLDELVPAYAISIHKSQGSEFDAVIIALFMQHFTLLQRNLLYTAITRAKKLCVIIGQPKAIAIAIGNNTQKDRCTFLSSMLTTEITCR